MHTSNVFENYEFDESDESDTLWRQTTINNIVIYDYVSTQRISMTQNGPNENNGNQKFTTMTKKIRY